jgi:tRNA acetyltransferase TAN1
MDFNLLISTYRYREPEAQNELHEILRFFGDSKPESDITEISGILVGHTTLDTLNVVWRIRNLVHDEPWRVRYILRLIPVEAANIEDSLDTIRAAAAALCSKMQERETFRITVERRCTALRSSDIILAIAQKIHNKVDLENPVWTVLVEVIGRRVGISVLRRHEIFSSVIEKRGSFTY